jgi:VanZ family protein
MAGFMRWLWIWGPAAAQMFAIFSASSIPDLTELPGQLSDKTGHFVGYAMLGALVLRAMAEARWDRVTTRRAAAALLASALYALTDEFHQRFVHGRSPERADWMYDVAGAAAAVALVLAVSAIIARLRAKTRAV